MAAHAYALRSKLNTSGVSLKNSPSNSPFAKTGTRSPRKPNTANATLNLEHVIGTTSTGPGGLSCHAQSNTYAYCAGSAALLATVDENGQVSQRFFKARPTASSINPCISFYDQSTPTNTPKNRRKSVLPPRLDGYGPTPTGSPFREWADDGNGQTWTARERIKAASSVSISHDGRLLAMGETGYNPRVLIFSTAEDAAPNMPLSIMSEHTYGVRSVAFSPDSRYLATLGDVNDGFLFMWSVNTKSGSVKLHSANRCTTSISDMIWCGNTLITVGTRHIKAWKVSEPSKPSPSKRARIRTDDTGNASPAPQTLVGRNVLLGSLVDETFTCAVPISETQALICTENGHVCLLKDGENGTPNLSLIRQIPTRILCISHNRTFGKVAIGDRQGMLYVGELNALISYNSNAVSDPNDTLLPLSPEPGATGTFVAALGAVSKQFVALDGNCNFNFIKFEGNKPNVGGLIPSHNDSVRGLQMLNANEGDESFYTWSAAGSVMFWDRKGKIQHTRQINVEQIPGAEDDWVNELKVVRYLLKSKCYISGDRLGVLKLIRASDWTIIKEMRAHGSEITDIAIHESEDGTLIATSGRDRVVQLFRAIDDTLDLVQTLDEHIGAVTEVMFSNAGDRLLSASADRTIIVRDKLTKDMGESTVSAYLSSRIITLKATPLSMALLPGDADGLIVSTMDRNVLKLIISTGAVSDAFKVTDPENDDTVILNSICMSNTRVDGAPRLLVGCSSTDKSIRVYDIDREILLTREAGHTEGISDVALREDCGEAKSAVRRTIFSTGLDGTIMTWNLILSPPHVLTTPLQEFSQTQAMSGSESFGTPIKPSPASLPPLRKVLTSVEIAQFTTADSGSGSPTPSSLRNNSPSRLRRRASKLTLTHSSIDEDEAIITPTHRSPTFLERKRVGRSTADSPSPPPPSRLQKQRSHGDLRSQRSRPELRSSRTSSFRRSPSPSEVGISATTQTTPRNNMANNSRPLRKPPSVPADLRGHALRQSSRRQSVTILPTISNGGDLSGSVSMASEQVSRMLKSYRAKVIGTNTCDRETRWDDIEAELQKTLNAVKERRAGVVQQQLSQYRGNASERSTSGDVTGGSVLNDESSTSVIGSSSSDVEGLVGLMQKTGL